MSDIGRKFRFKISVIGDGRVGKTTLIKRLKGENLEIKHKDNGKNADCS